jgi:hypothetical protein
LYCSREIGVIKALKGSDYCSAAHRKKHGERLAKAVNQMFAPEPPPAGMVGFFLKWAPRQGNTLCVLAPWQSGPTPNPIRSSRTWRFSIDSSIDSTVDSTIALPDAGCAPPPPPSPSIH